MEGLIARLAATRITDDQLEQLRALRLRMLHAQREGRSGDLPSLSREPDAAERVMRLHVEHSASARGATFET